jgi:DNA repair exonuclease SbcCD ATPase subunit
MDEEVVVLEEQLAAANADIERMQSRLADLEARASTRETELTDLRRKLEATRGEVGAREASLSAQASQLDELRSSLAEARAQSQEAAVRYREAVLAHESDLPAELVGGDTVSEIEASLERARRTVSQVRQHLEDRAQELRVPAGAPARGSPDVSALSAAEKIRLGLQQT